MITVEDLNMRLGFVEHEIAGEKLVTRHVLKQAGLNADDLAEIKTQLRHFGNDISLIKAAQLAQGGALNILIQDVAALRGETIALRRGQEAMNARLDETNGRIDQTNALLDKSNSRIDQTNALLDKTNGRVDQTNALLEQTNGRIDRMQVELNTRFVETNVRLDHMQEETNARFDRLERNVAAILIAVSPRDPA